MNRPTCGLSAVVAFRLAQVQLGVIRAKPDLCVGRFEQYMCVTLYRGFAMESIILGVFCVGNVGLMGKVYL